MAAQGDVIFFLGFADEADIKRPMNFGAGKHTKWRHVRFGEDFGLVVADDQENVGLESFNLLLECIKAVIDAVDKTLQDCGSFFVDLGRLRHAASQHPVDRRPALQSAEHRRGVRSGQT